MATIYNFMTQHSLSDSQKAAGLINPVMTTEQQDNLRKLMIVDPTIKAFEVQEQAEKLADLIKEIVDMNGGYHSALDGVHIMGQVELMFYLYNYLRNDMIPVYISTTERKSVETKNADGSVTKTAVFEFVQLRPLM